jgi:hypothetical protein
MIMIICLFSRQSARYGLELGHAKNPAVLAGAVIFAAAHLLALPNKPTIRQICAVSQLREGQVASCYHGLRPHVSRLIPAATQQRILTLHDAVPPSPSSSPVTNGQPLPQASQPSAASTKRVVNDISELLPM